MDYLIKVGSMITERNQQEEGNASSTKFSRLLTSGASLNPFSASSMEADLTSPFEEEYQKSKKTETENIILLNNNDVNSTKRKRGT
jgi:hypothetical protein